MENNKIIIGTDRFGENFWNAANSLIRILVDAGYECSVEEPNIGNVEISYHSNNCDVEVVEGENE